MTSYHSQYPLLHIDLNQQAIDCHDPILQSPKSASFSLSSSSSSTHLCPSNLARPQNDQIISSDQLIKKEKVTESEKLTCFSAIKEEKSDTVNWSSSKMRLNRKSSEVNHGAFSSVRDHKDCSLRVCSDCYTTRTPLWRSGPRGPKSLCNACGIRQRKARRALAAATGGAGPVPPNVNDSSSPIKKRRKLKKNRAAEDALFPQDETDAAILLMALSYGIFNNAGH